MNKLFALLTALAMLVSAVGFVEASTLDKRIIAVQGSRIDLGGDLDEFSDYLDDIYSFGLFFHFPLGDYFALQAQANRMTIKGSAPEFRASLDSTVTSLSGGLLVQFLPRSMINPFVAASYTYAMVDVDVSLDGEQFKDDDSEQAVSLTGGLEWSIGERFSVIGSFTRTRPQSRDRDFDIQNADDDQDSIGISINAWITERFLGAVYFAQELEEDTRTYGLRLGLQF